LPAEDSQQHSLELLLSRILSVYDATAIHPGCVMKLVWAAEQFCALDKLATIVDMRHNKSSSREPHPGLLPAIWKPRRTRLPNGRSRAGHHTLRATGRSSG
jgi:hypothetical protein